jgi:N6-adenosine-specific RNA methylase IME4
MPTGGPANDRSWDAGNRPSRLPYETMAVDEITELWRRCDHFLIHASHLYLWTVNAHLEASYAVARRWGFRPSQLLVWAKPPRGLGLGGVFTNTTEFCIFARRGSSPPLQRQDTSWWAWPRGPHSAKPEAFYDLVEQVSPGPYLELFARRQRLGWDTWGNEALEHVSLAGVPRG